MATPLSLTCNSIQLAAPAGGAGLLMSLLSAEKLTMKIRVEAAGTLNVTDAPGNATYVVDVVVDGALEIFARKPRFALPLQLVN